MAEVEHWFLRGLQKKGGKPYFRVISSQNSFAGNGFPCCDRAFLRAKISHNLI